ncbi:MAG: tRNA (adenosine(37)-N6)-threonylcarbamoyltransferase complex ATPase subunit type 1 TsaE [Chloroflexi bacterium]|nr:tRNA (adenosine(37)-N6)-threonylcarbamoyltransferase complex ATPase subunit type 1 TsaE [Chloroflexota bacterium]
MTATTVVVRVPTAEHMRRLGSALGQVAQAGDRFLLEGPFGAGKTTFVQGLAHGLDITTPVGSPSFVIETRYTGRLVLYHVDLYRLDRIEPELLEALEEHLFGEGVTAVEWAERLPGDLRLGGARLLIKAEDGDGRRVELTSGDERLRRAAAFDPE